MANNDQEAWHFNQLKCGWGQTQTQTDGYGLKLKKERKMRSGVKTMGKYFKF